MLDAALETVLGVLRVAKVLVLAADLEPGGVVAGLGGPLEVAEGGAGVVGDELGVDAGGRAHGAHVDGLGDGGRDGGLRALGDLEDDGDGDVDELLELGIVDLRGPDGGIGGGGVDVVPELLGAIDEREDFSAPDDAAGGVGGRLLDGGLLDGQDRDGREGRGEGGRPIAGGRGNRERRRLAGAEAHVGKGVGERVLVVVVGRARGRWGGAGEWDGEGEGHGGLGRTLRGRRGPRRPV